MRLLGTDIDAAALLARAEARLRGHGGASHADEDEWSEEPVEPRVDPMAFHLQALETHADATRPLPLETHRSGLGRAVLVAKWAYRRAFQFAINETLGRQRRFNEHSRDALIQLQAEVERLRREVAELRGKPEDEASGGKRPRGRKR